MGVVRFTVSLDRDLVAAFDARRKREACPTRSKAVGDLIRAMLVREEWQTDRDVAGAVVLVYDHHKRDLVKKLTVIQHDFHDAILSTQHIHLDHDNCLEIVAVRGPARVVGRVFQSLKSVKGLKHASLAAGTTGKHLH